MRDFTGHELQVGDIVIAPGEDNLYYARIDDLDEFGYPDADTHDLAWIQLLEGLENPRAHRYHYRPTRLIWYTSEYAHLPKTYVGAIFNRDGHANA